MEPHSQTFETMGEDETKVVARRLAHTLTPGDCIMLSGDLGAGKSAFAREVVLTLCPDATDVPSPTFTLVQTYQAKLCEVWHSDLYRLTDPSEVVELGLEDAMMNHICLIEWPDRLGDDAPKTSVWVDFAFGQNPEYRKIVITGHHSKLDPA